MVEQPRSKAILVRRAQRTLANAKAAVRTRALKRLGEILDERRQDLLAINAADVEAADASGLGGSLRKRLARPSSTASLTASDNWVTQKTRSAKRCASESSTKDLFSLR